jgi:hypothetical protein
LRRRKDHAGAERAFRQALEQNGWLKERFPGEPGYLLRKGADEGNIAMVLSDRGENEESLKWFTVSLDHLRTALGRMKRPSREGLEWLLDTTTALVDTLEALGRREAALAALDGAVAVFKHSLRADPKNAYALAHLPRIERMRTLLPRLRDVLASKAEPKTAAEACELALLCRQAFGKHHAAAARLFEGAFAAEPKLAADLTASHRYNAACAAALAAEQGEDATTLDDKERVRLRKQAHDWLRADLTLRTKQLESGPPADRAAAQQALRHWQKDSDLAGIRDPEALAKLPAEERAACAKLWADVAALLKKAEEETK